VVLPTRQFGVAVDAEGVSGLLQADWPTSAAAEEMRFASDAEEARLQAKPAVIAISAGRTAASG